MTEYTSCVPERANSRYFKLRDDFRAICRADISNAAARRVVETKTNQRIAYLREKYDIPDDLVPAEELVWIDTSLRELERLTLGVRKSSSYARAMSEKNADGDVPSLIQLGFLRSRIIARADGTQRRVATNVQRDIWGREYIVVADMQGHYAGKDEVLHSATQEGFAQISKQFLLCIDQVRAAIAGLDGNDPPKPVKRWRPPSGGGGDGPPRGKGKKGGAPAQQTTKSTPSDAQNEASTAHTAHQRGNLKDGKDGVSFMNENNTIDAPLSTSTLTSNFNGGPPCPILRGGYLILRAPTVEIRGAPSILRGVPRKILTPPQNWTL